MELKIKPIIKKEKQHHFIIQSRYNYTEKARQFYSNELIKLIALLSQGKTNFTVDLYHVI